MIIKNHLPPLYRVLWLCSPLGLVYETFMTIAHIANQNDPLNCFTDYLDPEEFRKELTSSYGPR